MRVLVLCVTSTSQEQRARGKCPGSGVAMSCQPHEVNSNNSGSNWRQSASLQLSQAGSDGASTSCQSMGLFSGFVAPSPAFKCLISSVILDL